MTDKELMQQALEAIEFHSRGDEVDEALITALRKRLAQPEQGPVAWIYQEGLEALKSGRPWTAYGSSGEGRIPLYLDAVARRVEPPAAESGAGFESLPASPTWWDDPVPQMRREWQGLTDDEVCPWFQENTALTNEAAMRITRAIEAKLKEKNT